MRFMQTESVLQTKNRSGPAKNRFSVALLINIHWNKGQSEPTFNVMLSDPTQRKLRSDI